MVALWCGPQVFLRPTRIIVDELIYLNVCAFHDAFIGF